MCMALSTQSWMTRQDSPSKAAIPFTSAQPLVWASASKAERSALASIRSRRPLSRPAISPVSSVMALSLATYRLTLLTRQLGVGVSSERFKKDIDPMGKTSEQIYALKPVTFHYKNDTTNTAQFGLIAEEVAKVNPALIGVDKDGKPYTVRYNQINAMLLNEFLKEHQTVQQLKATTEKQQATIALQEGEIKALTASLREQAEQIQKVSAQIEMGKPAPQVVENR